MRDQYLQHYSFCPVFILSASDEAVVSVSTTPSEGAVVSVSTISEGTVVYVLTASKEVTVSVLLSPSSFPVFPFEQCNCPPPPKFPELFFNVNTHKLMI